MSFGGGVVSSAGLRCRLRVKGWVPQKTLATIGEGLGKPEKPPSSSSGKQSWGRCGGCGGSGVGVEVGEDEGEAFSSSCREGDNNRKRGRRGEERSGSPLLCWAYACGRSPRPLVRLLLFLRKVARARVGAPLSGLCLFGSVGERREGKIERERE